MSIAGAPDPRPIAQSSHLSREEAKGRNTTRLLWASYGISPGHRGLDGTGVWRLEAEEPLRRQPLRRQEVLREPG